MEWILQIVDELDDAAGAVRHLWTGLWRDIAVAAAGFAAFAAVLAGMMQL